MFRFYHEDFIFLRVYENLYFYMRIILKSNDKSRTFLLFIYLVKNVVIIPESRVNQDDININKNHSLLNPPVYTCKKVVDSPESTWFFVTLYFFGLQGQYNWKMRVCLQRICPKRFVSFARSYYIFGPKGLYHLPEVIVSLARRGCLICPMPTSRNMSSCEQIYNYLF